MRIAGLGVIALLISSTVAAQVHVRGYVRKDGTYVAPHYRSAPDGDFYNNWSTKGNINPYTGKPGTRVTPPNGGRSPRASIPRDWGGSVSVLDWWR